MNCEEILSSITEVYPVPINTHLLCDIPFNVVRDTLPASSFRFMTYRFEHMETVAQMLSCVRTLPGMLVEGAYNADAHASSIEILPDVSVKNSQKMGNTGAIFTVKLTAKTYADITSLSYFSNLRYTSVDLLIVDSADNLYLVRGSLHSSSVSVTPSVPDSSGHEIEAEVLSVNGIQKIV